MPYVCQSPLGIEHHTNWCFEWHMKLIATPAPKSMAIWALGTAKIFIGHESLPVQA